MWHMRIGRAKWTSAKGIAGSSWLQEQSYTVERGFRRDRVVKEQEAALAGKQDWKVIYFKTLLISHMLSQTSTDKHQGIYTQVVCPARRHQDA